MFTFIWASVFIFFSWTVSLVLEPDQAIFNSVHHSWLVWRWPVGLCDLWLHTLLLASWSAIIRSCKISQGSYFLLNSEAYPTIPSHGILTQLSAVPQKYHLNHHFRIQTKGFGITSTLWDHVFGTLPSTKAADKSTWFQLNLLPCEAQYRGKACSYSSCSLS